MSGDDVRTLLDVSRPLREGMPVWPGDTPFVRAISRSAGGGDFVTVSALTLSSHAGTHVDAPAHLAPTGGGVETLDAKRFIGAALVVDARGSQALGEELLPSRTDCAGKRILFRTDYTLSGADGTAMGRVPARGEGPASSGEARAGEALPYGSHMPYVTPALARRLVEWSIPLVGVDGPSVDPFGSAALEAHHVLAAGGVAILEHLDLASAEPGEWFLIALPLLIPGCDGSPVRAVLLKHSG